MNTAREIIAAAGNDLEAQVNLLAVNYNNRGRLLNEALAENEQMRAALQKIVNNWDDLHPKDRQQARAALTKARGIS